jgi:tetratricopeptide (TPR) repeat protein
MQAVDDTSPRFVVQAMASLGAGKTEGAIVACREGIARYPRYATGYWVLGKCYEAQGKTSAANEQYRKVAALLPGLAIVRAAIDRTHLPSAGPGASDVESMLRTLQDARRLQAAGRNNEVPPPVDISTPSGGSTIATATLAEIYAGQGEYGAALEAYKRLIQQRPDDAGRHAERIAELEQLLQRTDKLGQP